MRRVDRTRLPTLGPDPAFRFPAIHKDRLPNGLRVWSVPQPALPIATFLLLVPAGSAADPPGRAGLASLTGDMLDEGSGDRSAIQIHEDLARIGAELDTEVGSDATIVILTTLSRHAERGLALLGDIVVRPRLGPADVDRVRTLRLSRLQQLRDLPPAVADRAFLRVVYAAHPYGHPALGFEDSLERLAAEDVARFHRQAYAPGRSTLIAVGDITAEQVLSAADRTLGDWTEPDVFQPSFDFDGALAPPPAAPDPRFALIDRPGAAQSELRIGQVGVPRTTPEYHPLLVMNMILGGQFVSRVNLNLRERRGYTYGARTMFDFRRGRGPFTFQAAVQTNVTGDAIREALVELEAIRGTRPATPAELETARAALVRGYPRNFESVEQIARAAAQLSLYDLADDYFEQFAPLVSRVDADAVMRVARAWLDPSRMATLIVGDRQAISPSLVDAGLGHAVVMSAA